MLLETRGDYQFANQLTSSIKELAKEIKRSNDILTQKREGEGNDYQTLYKLVKEISSGDIPQGVSDEINQVYADCQNLMESLERSGICIEKTNETSLPKEVIS